MKRTLLFYAIIMFCFLPNFWAQEEKLDTLELSKQIEQMQQMWDFQSKIPYETGRVELSEKVQLNIPAGYKFIPKKESEKIIFEFWGNPESEGILGMLVRDSFDIMDPLSWAFVMTQEEEGYVKDEDANKINYDDLLKSIQESEIENNKEREKNGYSAITTVRWASPPYYDNKNKILHWAKELKVSDVEENTLNYDVRILGRSGLLSLNAVGSIAVLDSVKKHIPEIINIATFKDGHQYADFDPSMDKVAAYTVGGLVAGKILAKAGILALLLKNIKLIGIGLIALISLFKNKIAGLFGKKNDDEEEG